MNCNSGVILSIGFDYTIYNSATSYTSKDVLWDTMPNNCTTASSYYQDDIFTKCSSRSNLILRNNQLT